MQQLFRIAAVFLLATALVSCTFGVAQEQTAPSIHTVASSLAPEPNRETAEIPMTQPSSSKDATPSQAPSAPEKTPSTREEIPLPTPSTPEETKPPQSPSENASKTEITKEDEIQSMEVTIGNKIFPATLEENVATDALVELMKKAPLVISMEDYSGFEKVGSLGRSLPTSNSNITASEGDIVLYQGNQIVVFYGSNTWSYTEIGKIDAISGWKEALGDGTVTITFSIPAKERNENGG